MKLHRMTSACALALAFLAAGCMEAADDADEDPTMEMDAAAAPQVSQIRGPDTTAAGLWTHLSDARYRDTWSLWPGKDRLYTGTEPHGMLLTTYVNGVAAEALRNGQVADLPVGSIIVKENWMPDSTFDAATVMYRVAGYNPDHQDWLFAKYDEAGAADAFGRAPMCQSCHQSAPSGYIYTPVATR